MGTRPSIVFRPRRSANAAGTEIREALEWFHEILDTEFDNLKQSYDKLDQEKKNEFLSAFDGQDVMMSQGTFTLWVNENEDEPEDLEAARTHVLNFIS